MQYTPKQVENLQRGTRGVLVFGIVASVAANVTNTFVRPQAATTGFWLLVGAAILHAFAPVVLFVCTELVSRIPIHSKVLGWFRLAVTFAVGGFAAWVSYWNMEELAGIFDPGSTSRFFYPLIIDGMMIVATISLIELGRLARAVDEITSNEAAAALAAVKAAAPTAWVVTAEEKAARKRAGYDDMPTEEKIKWSTKYRADVRVREARAAARAAKAQPATSPTDASEQQLAASGASN